MRRKQTFKCSMCPNTITIAERFEGQWERIPISLLEPHGEQCKGSTFYPVGKMEYLPETVT